jgi:2-polyprenyl-6-hydroxyphenyl methylase/3-demethylubiquinone-9 3-methyltransferase
MWDAIDHVSARCASGGQLFIAIYNYMGSASRRWSWVKRTYCRLPEPLKLPFAAIVIAPIQIRSFLIYVAQGKAGSFFREKIDYKKRRGMSWWHDVIDWVGGYPYEDARPEEVFEFVQKRGFTLKKLTTSGGGIGCNQFVFRKDS